MFIAAVIIPFYLLAIVAMCFMDTAFKAIMFFVLLLIATFVYGNLFNGHVCF